MHILREDAITGVLGGRLLTPQNTCNVPVQHHYANVLAKNLAVRMSVLLNRWIILRQMRLRVQHGMQTAYKHPHRVGLRQRQAENHVSTGPPQPPSLKKGTVHMWINDLRHGKYDRLHGVRDDNKNGKQAKLQKPAPLDPSGI